VRTLVAISGVLVIATACIGGDTPIRVADQEVTATASRLRLRHIRGHDMVFGQLTIRGTTQTLVAANLECFWLTVGPNKSESIWVDSLIDTLRGDYPARDGTVSVGVYWAMKDLKTASDADFEKATLSIKNPFIGPCFKFASQK